MLLPQLVGKAIVLAIRNSDGDRILRLAAALAFYTALALAPLLVVLLWCLSSIGALGELQLVREVTHVVGTEGGRFIEAIIENAQKSQARGWAGAISIVALVISATGVFSELQDSLSLIWKAPTKPRSGILAWFHKRLLSFAMVGAIAFLMIVSLAASTAVGVLEQWIGEASAWRFVTEGLSFSVFVALFAAMFRLLPDIRIAWRDVFGGALVTALMFVLGKYLIGLYLAHGTLVNAYGAAGSLLIILVWVYYSSIIVFFGAELAHAWMLLRKTTAPRADDAPLPAGERKAAHRTLRE
ncbi:MAG: YihY/virulence factor BrkB family protein [Planctomycetota bacterium]